MDLLPDDQARVADQLAKLASDPGPRVHGSIMGAVSRAHGGGPPVGAPRPHGWLGGFLGREHRSQVALILTFTLTVPLVTWNIAHSSNYHTTLNPSVMSLVGGVDEGLASQISFDAKNQAYVFNADGKKAQSPAPTDTYSLTVGADKEDPTSTYSVDLPVNPAQGFTYYSNHLQLSFTLIPQFPMGPAQESQGRIVYPLENGGEAIYTVKSNGLREDLVFTQPTTTANFTYQLKLPDTLQAQNKDGVIGIYSADPSLFGNISFGSDTDKLKVIDARSKSAKTNLVFGIAPPTVASISGGTTNQVNYQLSGDQLQVTAQGLSRLTYPITLDPSIVINTTAGFLTGKNEDNNISFPTNAIDRGGVTGGVIGAWTANTNALSVATDEATSVAYNGYVYEIGGNTGSATAAVYYAPINADATIGTWTATTSLPVATYASASVAYNGYVYEIGGSTGTVTAVVDYAPINADGTIGTWTATTPLLHATEVAQSVVYNGYVYEIGGCTACPTSVAEVDYAPINANGTIGTWTATTPLLTATQFPTSVAYNGYLYVIGGNTTAATAVVDYAVINANGTIGSWLATTSLPVATYGATSVVYDGYVYEIGGFTTATTAVVDYAPINANGTIGSWTATTSLPAATRYATGVAYSGYVYEIGGFTTADTTTVDYAPIRPAGYIGSGNPTAWSATSSLTKTTMNSAAVAWNGCVYLVGGYSSAQGGGDITTIEYASINSNGTLSAWAAATTTLGTKTRDLAVAAYNGYLYEIGGYVTGVPTAAVNYVALPSSGCNITAAFAAATSLLAPTARPTSVAYNGYLYEIGGDDGLNSIAIVDYVAINADGTLATPWQATTSLPVATEVAASDVYNGYLYEIIGGTSEVDYVAINANGTLATPWQATTSLPVATSYPGSVAYNGYLYEIGGSPSPTIPTAVVNYAPINTDGTIGAWTATTSLPAATSEAGSVVYKGYLYEVGGCTGTCSTANVVATVDYAPINNGGPGTLGSWTATNSLPTPIDSATSVAYNGYVYEIGGQTSSAFSTVSAKGGGSSGSDAGTTIHTGGAGAAATGQPGGGGGSSAGTGSNGNPGSGSGAGGAAVTGGGVGGNGATSSLPGTPGGAPGGGGGGDDYTAPGGAASGAAGQVKIIETAGATNTYTTAGTTTYTVPSGITQITVQGWGGGQGGGGDQGVTGGTGGSGGDFAQSVASVSAGQQFTVVVGAAGSIFVALADPGGDSSVSAVTGVTAAVDYAPFNANGTIGAWTATTSLPAATFQATSVVYNGYVYEIGGCTSALCGATAVVDYALICTGSNNGVGGCGSTPGTIGTWNPNPTSLLAATYDATSVAYNGYVYEIGGCPTTCPTAAVYYAPINSNGTIGTWTATTSLPASVDRATSVVYNGYVYEIAGNPGINVVDYAPLNTNGTIGTWIATTSLPVTNDSATSVAYNGYLYEVGGNGRADVYDAPINANGTLGTWISTTSLPTATQVATSVVYNGYLYEIGGFAGGAYATTVDYAPLNVIPRIAHYSKLFNEGAAGGLGSWTATTSLLAATQQATSVAYNGFLYEIGGCSTTCPTTEVDYAPIGEDGTLGAWTANPTSLLHATDQATSVAYNGYVYEIGGFTTTATAEVDYAPINANGTVGTWTATTSLLAATYDATSVVYNGYVYEIGGYTTAVTSTVAYAPLNANGTVGTWTTTTSLPVATYFATSVAYNGYLYEIGGYTTAVTAVVDYVAINSNGTLGSPWTATTSLPAVTSDATSVAYNGYLYEIGGCHGGCPTNAVSYAPLNANGTLGSWTTTMSLLPTNNEQFASSVVYNGYVYEVGGFSGIASDIEVDYAPIQYPISIGTLVSITYTGTLPGGAASISYETAGSNGVLSASATAPSIAQGNCISGSIQYIWVRITLDDSQVGGFADSVGTNNANLTSFTINYMSHPPANQRLHGGKFFSNNVLQPLDTCHP